MIEPTEEHHARCEIAEKLSGRCTCGAAAGQMVERIARALCDADLPHCGGSDGTRLNPDMPNWHRYRRPARIALDALEEPTAEMWAAVNIVEPVGSGRNRVINLVSAEGWRAMLAAARLAE